ncbi:MAG: CvpA family protein [bacterium]
MVIFDLVLLVILFIFVGFGYWLGLIHTFGALVGVVIGAYLAGVWYEPLGDWWSPVFLSHDSLAKIIAFIVLFLVINRLIGFIFWIIDRIFNIVSIIPFLKSINRLGGALLGLAEGVLALGLILFVIGKYSNSEWFNQVVGDSGVAGWIMAIAGIIIPLLPEALKMIKSKF